MDLLKEFGLVLFVLIHIVFSDSDGLSDLVFLIEDLGRYRKTLTQPLEGEKFQFLKNIRIAKAKTGKILKFSTEIGFTFITPI